MTKNGFKYSPWLPLLAGTVLRVVDLGGRSLWVDEGLTAGLVSEPFGAMLNACIVHGQAPLFYACLWPWVRVLGLSEVSLAAFSAILGITTIYVVYRFVADLAGKKEAFLASLITALAPFMIYASNDARPYSFFGLISLCAVYFFWHALQTNEFKYWLLTGIFTVACPYTHLLGWSVALFGVAYVLIARPYRTWAIIRNLGIMLLSVGIAYFPLAFATIRQFVIYGLGTTSPTGRGGLINVMFIAVKQFMGGFYRILADYYFMDIGGAGLSKIAGMELLLLAVSMVFAFGLPLVIAVDLIKNKLRWGLYLSLAYLIPFLQVFWEGTDPRRFTPSATALYALTALAYFGWKKPMRIAAIALFLLVATFSLGKMYSMTSSIVKPEDYRQVSRIIRENRGPVDAIVYHGGTCGSQTWRFYDPGGSIFGNPKYAPHDFKLTKKLSPEEIFSEESFQTRMDTLLASHPQVWMVLSYTYSPRVQPLVEKWSDQYAIEVVYTDPYLLLLKIAELEGKSEEHSLDIKE